VCVCLAQGARMTKAWVVCGHTVVG
jgi:hypothetical protein